MHYEPIKEEQVGWGSSSSFGCVCVWGERIKLNFKQIRCNASKYAKNEDLYIYIYTRVCVKGSL